MVQLDATNMRILAILQKDARTSFADLARSVNRAESTVRERVAGLERANVIRGYRALVDPVALGLRAQALVRAECDRQRVVEVGEALRSVPYVTRAVLTTGPRPLEISLVAEDAHRLEDVLERQLAPLSLRDVEAALVLSTLVEDRAVPLDTAPAPLEARRPAPMPLASAAATPRPMAATPPIEDGPLGTRWQQQARW